MKRSKVLLVLFLTLCSSLPILAGDDGFDHVKLGVGGGLNAGYTTSFNAENLYVLDSYKGFYLGPQFDIRINRHLGIDSALFLQKDELSFGFWGDDVVLTSLQIPVNVSVALYRSNVIALLVEAGPQFSYRLSEKRMQLDNGTLTFADYTPSINLGVVAEVTDLFRLGARLNLPTRSLADIKDTLSDVDSFKMSTLQITAAILF